MRKYREQYNSIISPIYIKNSKKFEINFDNIKIKNINLNHQNNSIDGYEAGFITIRGDLADVNIFNSEFSNLVSPDKEAVGIIIYSSNLTLENIKMHDVKIENG